MPTKTTNPTLHGILRTGLHIVLIAVGIFGMHYIDVETFQQESTHNAADEQEAQQGVATP
jgi:hypothetical protein